MRSVKATMGACALAATAALALAGMASAQGAATPASGHFTGTLADATTWIADVPADWNGTLLLYSHGFGPLTAADAPDPVTQAALLARGYALAGSSYDPNGSEWALDTAVSDQFGTLRAVEHTVLPRRPAKVLAFGQSMGGLVSALEAQDGTGRIDGALTTCGIVAGGINLNEFQLDGEYAMARLLLPGKDVQLVNFGGPDGASQASATAAALTAAAAQAQQTAAGRARLGLALAFLNAAPWDPSAAAPTPASDPAAQESAQYDLEFTGAFSILDFIELGRAEVAVPEAVDERLPEQVAVARRADLMGVVALHLHGDEVVADGVQVEFGDGQAPGRDRRGIERSDRGGVCRDVRVPGQVGQVSAEPEASRAVEGRDLVPERRPGQDGGVVHAGVPVGAAAVGLVDRRAAEFDEVEDAECA